MSIFFEIAYAAAAGNLTLFTGTGFSKAITDNAAPGWQQLLEQVCRSEPALAALLPVLFPVDGSGTLTLEEVAQVIHIHLINSGEDIRFKISNIIEKIQLSGNNEIIKGFIKSNKLNIITTNFDKLIEQLVDGEACVSYCPGMPIPRATSNTNIYHVHGSIDFPSEMVVTSDDYFGFINSESFYSRKMSTLLHEGVVVILGYSLADTNLKAILNDHHGFSRRHFVGGNIIFVSRKKVDQHVKDYYSYCYGIRVLDATEIISFFAIVSFHRDNAEKAVKTAITDINEVLFKKHSWTNHYLRENYSFYSIVASVAAIGKSINDPAVVEMMRDIIDRKNKFTLELNAWSQYEHLAQWLVHIGSLLEIRGTTLEEIYLAAAARSMDKMSAQKELGYSWDAYKTWSAGWSTIIASNRALLREYCSRNGVRPDTAALLARP